MQRPLSHPRAVARTLSPTHRRLRALWLSLPLWAAAALLAGAALAQSPEASCILAGRVNEEARWSPRLPGVELLDANGQVLLRGDRATLAAVRQVRLSAPALLSRCDGGASLASGPDAPGAKTPGPALMAGTWAVDGVGFPRLAKSSGELVELRVAAPAERATMLSR